jgi:hypothetical protein
MSDHIPLKRVVVSEVIHGRYTPGSRPVSWDGRVAGIEKIRSVDGEVVELESSAQQSTPALGWEILLFQSATTPSPIRWTLFGIHNVQNG